MYRAIIIGLMVLAASCMAVDGDLSGDGKVDMTDLSLLSAGYLELYDANDLTDTAVNWMYGCNRINKVPVIEPNDIPVPAAVAYDDCYITLGGSDPDSYPNEKLSKIITQLPTAGTLYDTAEWSGEIVNSYLPYEIARHSSLVVYRSYTATLDSFKYKIYDGQDFSNEVTVEFTTSASSADSLCFDGSGYATIADKYDTTDLVDGRGIAFFFRTTTSDCGLLSKRDATGGYELRIENGRLRVYLYDSSGQAGVYGRADNYRVDTGRWYVGAFAYNNGNLCVIAAGVENGDIWYMQNDFTGVSAGPYSNSADLLVGTATGSNNFTGEFDRLRVYSDCTGGGLDLRFLIVTSPITEPRTYSGVAEGLSGPIEPDVRFMFDEGGGSELTDDKGGLTATVTGNNWAAAAGNDPVPVKITAGKYRYKKYKRPFDQIIIDNR